MFMYDTEHIDKFKDTVSQELLAANASLARHKVLFATITE